MPTFPWDRRLEEAGVNETNYTRPLQIIFPLLYRVSSSFVPVVVFWPAGADTFVSWAPLPCHVDKESSRSWTIGSLLNIQANVFVDKRPLSRNSWSGQMSHVRVSLRKGHRGHSG